MRVSQLDAVTVARIELIDILLFDAPRRDAYPAVFGQVSGRCIHHALLPLPEAAPIVPVAISVIRATFRALLMRSPSLTLLLAPDDPRARIRAIESRSLAATAHAEARPASLALPLDALHPLAPNGEQKIGTQKRRMTMIGSTAR
jgi:hypothetical protein